MQKKATSEGQEKLHIDEHTILCKVFKGRAWEVFSAAQAQFPTEMRKIEQLLVNLALEGKISEMEGEQLYGLLREIGLPVRMNTTIRVLSHGKAESIAERFKKLTK